MAVPWLRLLDMLIGVTDLARGGRSTRTPAEAESQQLAAGSRQGHQKHEQDDQFGPRIEAVDRA